MKGGLKTHFPKGRQVDPALAADLAQLLGDDARRRDMLVENLHRVQDRDGCLTAAALAALADVMGLAQAEVYEVATFYAHFRVVPEGETATPPRRRVCTGIACELARNGAEMAAEPGTEFVPCVGACDKAPVSVDPAAVEVPAYPDLEAYRAAGGHTVLARIAGGDLTADDVLATLEEADLRGMGGAGFPVARKWRFLLGAPKPRVLAVNADEGEPGTFKDRFCLEGNPHRMLEGMLIAARVVAADDIYIYLRDEYPAARAILTAEIARLEAAGLSEGIRIHLRRGAGAYVCGEETALLESLEGKRGLPRIKPPFPAQSGLFGRPTLVNNVETLHRVTEILEKGATWYQAAGRPRFYSVSGRVRAPGVKEAPSGITVRELIEDHCGGMAEGHEFRAYLPGGASGGLLPASMGDLPLDFGTLEAHGCFIGSAAVVVLSDADDMREVVLNLMRFFDHESCGQCTPCRVGCEKMENLLAAGSPDRTLVEELAHAMRAASICGLGQAAPNPVVTALEHFPEAFS